MSQRRRPGGVCLSDALANGSLDTATDDARLTQRRLSHPTHRILTKSKRTHSVPLRYPPSVHPNLTDFGPVTLQAFLQGELKKHKDEQEKRKTDPLYRARYYQRQEALGLVNAPGSLRVHGRGTKARYTVDLSRRQVRSKDFESRYDGESASRSCNVEARSSAVAPRSSHDSAKQGASQRKPRVKAKDLRVTVSANHNFPLPDTPKSAPLPVDPATDESSKSSLSPLAPVFLPRSLPTAMSSRNVDFSNMLDSGDPAQSRDRSFSSTSTAPSKIPLLTRHRASSFERYADSSRREQRQYNAKGKALNGGDADDPAALVAVDSPRPRKSVTPFVTESAFTSPFDVVPPVPLPVENLSRSDSSSLPQNLTYWQSLCIDFEDQDLPNPEDTGLNTVFDTIDVDSTNTTRSPTISSTFESSHRLHLEAVRDLVGNLGENSSARVFDEEEDSASLTEARLQNVRDQQQAILNSLDLSDVGKPEPQFCNTSTGLSNFTYSSVVPEQLPNNLRQADTNRQKIWETHGLDRKGQLHESVNNALAALYPPRALQAEGENWLHAPNVYGEYPRRCEPSEPSTSARSPPICPATSPELQNLPAEIWEEGVLDYLSSDEVRTLRLVCKGMAEDLAPYIFRSVVTNFRPEMFDVKDESAARLHKRALFRSTMLEKYGRDINKFGISFEFDETAMSRAPSKLTERRIQSWYGDYTWPIGDYPYFKQLKSIDQLLDDDNRVLSEALSQLKNCSELALSVDSGYGWITGGDMSDLSVYRSRTGNGSRVFGKTFPTEDRCYGFGLREYFKWAQHNTINAVRKSLLTSTTSIEEEDLLNTSFVRDYDEFLDERQIDRERHSHTGGCVGGIGSVEDRIVEFDDINSWSVTDVIGAMINEGLIPHAQDFSPVLNLQFMSLLDALHAFGVTQLTTERHRRYMRAWRAAFRAQEPNGSLSAHQIPGFLRTATSAPARRQTVPASRRLQPQWPLIFNAFNVSAHCGGHMPLIQNRIASPASHPLSPAHLTEPQAQWIMETSWIQRSFLSAYIDAVRVNAKTLRHVHSLSLAKISSGLLPLLTTEHLWTSLSGLRQVKILVKPDWRQEHMPGLKFSSDTTIEPCEASVKFAQFLRSHISKLENLSNLTIGYCAGGEQQTGLYGRNQHILPAPITDDPRAWLTPHEQLPDPETMVTFNHIRVLTFQNCWFSPYMLKQFMHRSRDSSLRHLIFDSVSMTGENCTRTDGPLQTVAHNLKCAYKPAEWLQERVPYGACWARAIDNITPGKTFLDRKYDADMIDEEETPRPEKEFRGNVERITFRSCGYVKISGIPGTNLNQNNVVVQNSLWNIVDEGLRNRITAFRTSNLNDVPGNDGDDDAVDTADPGHATDPDHRPRRSSSLRSISNKPVTESDFRPVMQAPRIGPDTCFLEGMTKPYLLGSLTQCVHPVEKRILEQAWGMRFGWGSCMERWEAVEDGWLEGGTGRFSGEVWHDGSELKKCGRMESFDGRPEGNRFS